MPETELITIGEFARSCGLSASALRFYADAGVLVPAVVDESTGYRYYTHDQTAAARLVRHLRAVDMPLPAVATVLAEPDRTRAAQLLEAHLAALDQHLREVRTAATAARNALRVTTIGKAAGSAPTSPDAESAPVWTEIASSGTDLAARCDANAYSAGPAVDKGRVPGADVDAEVPGSTPVGRALGGDADTRAPGTAHVGRVSGADAVADAAPSAMDVGRPSADDAVVWVSGPLLAAAVDQVATATVTDPQWPVLDTILIEAGDDGLRFTATDRIRLATRTLRPTRSPAVPWTATVDAVELRSILSWLRRRHSVATYPGRLHVEFVAAAPVGVGGPTVVGPDDHETHSAATDSDPADWTDRAAPDSGGRVGDPAAKTRTANPAPQDSTISVDESDRRRCHRSTEVFPDYRAMLAALPPARTRVVLARATFLTALEESGSPVIALHLTPPHTVSLADCFPDRSTLTASAQPHTTTGRKLSATITGPSITIYFAVTALYPAVATAVGPDVMLDLIAPDLPARIRSADDGDLFTLAMPCRPESTEEPTR
ncbi:MerR family transcriptional regulator [Nocardia mangyaensis]|uniref:MerR family transcriptional regulator n=1 Tax=Nocardia mangyaensis TaxID=2213200 RepID=UPI0026774E1F|nr:MerR family transcriptional regulator [Nocardia mangyaensis]MDO3649472.1 MerR family transcriptional regulator [Nocardia mangyaensis]